ncbi:hypothetical protein X801_01558 [Opisthorchis viverrini]|uniref:Mediator of RNA polymerase II transcription subunit 25 n=1 Tax=Opisthorchis viverrini TaxID=6198 RepID=A0A1S8X779_OPIVI|nr:hypothetical protein X801_01558 [Opisthorchis viverrini]
MSGRKSIVHELETRDYCTRKKVNSAGNNTYRNSMKDAVAYQYSICLTHGFAFHPPQAAVENSFSEAYTSLYSLHGFYWRKPRQINTWVPDTPIIYRILKQIATVKHEERHATNEHADMFTGTPGHDLLEAAVEAFDAIDRARRGLCKQVQRHLILLTVSPINLDEVHKELVSSSDDCTKSGPLTNLRRRGVALSAFAPVPSASVLQLYEIINGTPPSPFYDRHWQTVALSRPLAADAHAQAEAELLLTEQRHQKKLMQDQPQIDPVLTNGHPHSLVGPLQGSSPSSPARYVSKMQRHSSQANYMEGYMNGQTATINSGIATTVGCSVSDNAYRGTPNKLGPAVPSGNNSSSPMVQPYPLVSSPTWYRFLLSKGPANESPISHGHRGLRTSSHSHGSTPPGATSRASVPRSIADVIRPSEPPQVPVSCSSLSAGHSGPNSVDQLGPGSAYGSDSVATPQGFSAGIMSPQQGYNSGAAMSTQLYSPASSTLANLNQSQSAAGTNVPYQPYQQLPPEGSNTQINLRQSTAMAQSPGSVQGTFRPPSNAASPVGQLVSYANTVGLSSPSASRGPTRQYSPQLPPQSQQPAPHQRHTSPHSGGPPHQEHGVGFASFVCTNDLSTDTPCVLEDQSVGTTEQKTDNLHLDSSWLVTAIITIIPCISKIFLYHLTLFCVTLLEWRMISSLIQSSCIDYETHSTWTVTKLLPCERFCMHSICGTLPGQCPEHLDMATIVIFVASSKAE